MLKVAFVMNPTAGIGGPLALKGSDSLSDEIRELHRGHAMDRSKLFLESLRSTRAVSYTHLTLPTTPYV